jgi:hypothetical protein
MENKKVGISWQQISFLVCSIQLANGGYFPLLKGGMKKCRMRRWHLMEQISLVLWHSKLQRFSPPLLFEGEMKKSLVENKTMGFHGEKVFFYMAFQIAE